MYLINWLSWSMSTSTRAVVLQVCWYGPFMCVLTQWQGRTTSAMSFRKNLLLPISLGRVIRTSPNNFKFTIQWERLFLSAILYLNKLVEHWTDGTKVERFGHNAQQSFGWNTAYQHKQWLSTVVEQCWFGLVYRHRTRAPNSHWVHLELFFTHLFSLTMCLYPTLHLVIACY